MIIEEKKHQKIIKFEKTLTICRKNGAFLLDSEDEEVLKLSNWRIKRRKNSINDVYVFCGRTKPDGYESLHRFILKAKKGEIVDHINGDTLDNRKVNLRLTNNSGNSKNRAKIKHKISKYKGVSVSGKRWRCSIMSDGFSVYFNFNSEKDAALKYNELALKYHGEFARLNVI